MERFAILIAVAVALAIPAGSDVQAQDTKPVTGMKPDRVTAPKAARKAMLEKEAALRKKRTECRAKAKAEKVSLLKRPAYVKECMAK
jgi:hypothetical protein